jgi:outer membrane protein
MRISRIHITVVLATFCCCLLNAQQTAPALTLQQAQDLALKNQPKLLASEAYAQHAGQLVREAKSAYYPSINGEITGSQANNGARIGAGFMTDSRLFNRFGYGLEVSQLITDSGRTPNLVASSKLQEQSSEKDIQATRDNVLLAVDQAYYDALLARSLVRVAQQTVAARQAVVDQVSELTKNKLKSDVDLSFAQVNLSDAKLMLIRAQNQLQGAYADLAQAMGTDQSVAYQLQDAPLASGPAPSPEPLIQQAYNLRPELASLRLQRESYEKFLYAERDLKRPTVNFNLVGGSLPFIVPGNANSDIPYGYEGAAINVQIPIFNGHLFSARREAAQYRLNATTERVRDLEQQIARDVRVAWGRSQTAYQAIAATQQLLKQANLALSLAQGRYQLGLSSIVELTQAQLAQTQAEVQYTQAQYGYQESYAFLQYTLGSLR